MGFKKGQVANPRGRGKGTLNKTTLLARDFAASIIDRPDVHKKILSMALAGTLPAAVLNMILMYRFGRPKFIVEQQPQRAASRKELLRLLTPEQRRQLNALNMEMLRLAPRVVDVVPVAVRNTPKAVAAAPAGDEGADAEGSSEA